MFSFACAHTDKHGVRWILVGMIIAATIGFVVGTTIERNPKHHGEAGHSDVASESTPKAESGKSAETKPTAHNTPQGTPHTEQGGAHAEGEGGSTHSGTGEAKAEKLFGINPESVPLTIVAVIVSLALALGGLASTAVDLGPRGRRLGDGVFCRA